MAEWFNAHFSKKCWAEMPSEVRILPPPPVVLKSVSQNSLILRYISKSKSDKMSEPKRDSNYMKGIENYSSEWPKKYELEAEKIKAVLGDDVKDIQHIGSTSIPGAVAKPLIDIGVLVDLIDDIDSFVKKLEPLGYSYKPDMSSVERIFLRKGDPGAPAPPHG